MKNKYFIILIASIVYLIFMNLLFTMSQEDFYYVYTNENNFIYNIMDNTNAGVGIGLSASATVIKNRWYGKITEFHSDKTISYLELFKISYIKIPLKSSFNFIPIHLSFLILIFFFIFRKKSRPKDI